MMKLTGDICPSIMGILENIQEDSVSCTPTYCGIPCTHGLAALGLLGLKAEDFVHECYTLAAYKRVYTPVINPAIGPNNWPTSIRKPMLPPTKVKMPGRPRRKRKLEEGEKGYRTMGDGTQKLKIARLRKNGGKKCHQKDYVASKCPIKDNLQVYNENQHKDVENQVKDKGKALVVENEISEQATEGQKKRRAIQPSPRKEITEKCNKKRRTTRCGWCRKEGHNRATCT